MRAFNSLVPALALWLAPALALAPAAPAAAQEITVSFGGDVNFARSRTAPSPTHALKYGRTPLAETTQALAPEWWSDVNFVNVETVVSARDGTPSPGKAFVFRSHPENFRHLMRLGANAFALANNHAHDHGRRGMADTLAFFEGERAAGRNLIFAGVGKDPDAYAPDVFEVRGRRIALSALTFGSGAFSPSATAPGMLHLTRPGQYDRALAALRDTPADLKILSLHYGTENYVGLDAGQRARFRRGIEEAGVHLVLGHHPHVVRAVEAEPERGRAVFHSLGNLLFAGGAVKDGAPVGHDYGLLGRAYFQFDGPVLRLTALEALPLKGVHLTPRPMTPGRAAATLRHLNGLSRAAAGDMAARFEPAGAHARRGMACFGGPYGPTAARLCCRVERGTHCDFPDLM
ncbi:MAG: CapA family protein [Pseudomonadota bacterium]